MTFCHTPMYMCIHTLALKAAHFMAYSTTYIDTHINNSAVREIYTQCILIVCVIIIRLLDY